MTRPPLVIRDGRHPFEVVVLIFTALIGGVGLIGPGFRSNAIEAAWGGGWSGGWYLMLLAFGLFNLWAVFSPAFLGAEYLARRGFNNKVARLLFARRSLGASLHLERVGLFGTGWAIMAYPPAAIAQNGSAGLTAGVMFLGLGLATGVRIRQIFVDLRKLRQLNGATPAASPCPVADPETG